jgi:cell division septation protein DedD
VTAGKYVIQVATYAVLEDANRIIQSLKQAGFESFFKKQVRNSTGHSFFTVCLGRFESYTNAQETLAKFRKAAVARPFQDAFIRTMEP